MRELRERNVDCPYCGESIEILIDPSVAEQDYVEDCQVCCRPIEFRVAVAPDGDIGLIVRSDNE